MLGALVVEAGEDGTDWCTFMLSYWCFYRSRRHTPPVKSGTRVLRIVIGVGVVRLTLAVWPA